MDRESKRIVFISKDIVVNQIHRDGPKITASFDKLTKNEIEAISELVAASMSLIFRYVAESDGTFRSTAAALLSSAVSTLIASIEVARHGFRRPYGAIARGIVETVCTVMHIATEPGALQDFLDDKLSSPKSISIAKKVFPPFGPMYGLLSNQFVHINSVHAKFEPTAVYAKDDDALPFIISTLKAHAWMIYVVTELAFHNEVKEPRYWKAAPTGGMIYDPSDEERRWQGGYFGLPVDELPA